MVQITFIEQDGRRHEVDAGEGASLMQAAVDNRVPGILGDCGGSCTCATCHAYIDPAFADHIAPAEADERYLLEGAIDVDSDSRLTCQVRVNAALEGLIVRLPKSQF